MGSLDVINCKSVVVECKERVPSISVEGTKGCSIFAAVETFPCVYSSEWSDLKLCCLHKGGETVFTYSLTLV